MTNRLQFGKWLAALGICAALTLPVFAQHPRGNSFQQNPNRPPKPAPAVKQQRQQAKQQRQQEKQAQREAQKNANRPPQANPESRSNDPNQPNPESHPNNNPNRPPNAYTPPPRAVTPQERQRNEQRFDKLPPQQKQEMRERAQTWITLTPQQRSHIKNDVMPKWQQLPPDRQRAIRSRLNVLKNMPEAARNQHLDDPNFTRGMTEDDKTMLRDLSHLHVGGAPEPPHE